MEQESDSTETTPTPSLKHEQDQKKPSIRSFIPPPPSHPPPPRPMRPPVVVEGGQEEDTEQHERDDDRSASTRDQLEIDDITLTEKTEEEKEREQDENSVTEKEVEESTEHCSDKEEEEEEEESGVYSYVRSESRERLDEATPSPDLRPSSVQSAPDYENVTEDMLNYADGEETEETGTSYMNVHRSQAMNSEDVQDDEKRQSRPTSYLNMAPFPPDFKPPSPDQQDGDSSSDPKSALRKPKNRVPPPPPPNYKEILRELSANPSSAVIPRPAAVTTRTQAMDSSSKPSLNKLASTPANISTSPAAPAKPPRVRAGRRTTPTDDAEATLMLTGKTAVESSLPLSSRLSPRPSTPDSIPRSPHRQLVKSQSSNILSDRSSTPESSHRHTADQSKQAPLRPAPTAPGHASPKISRQQPVKKPPPARVTKVASKDQHSPSAVRNRSPVASPASRQRAPARSAPPPPQALEKKTASPSPSPVRKNRSLDKTDKEGTHDDRGSPLPPNPISSTKQSAEEESVREDAPIVSEKAAHALEAMKVKSQGIQTRLQSGQVLPIGGQALADPRMSKDIFSHMNIIIVELQRVEGQTLGLHIAEGTVGTSKGHDMKGVFVKEIIPGTPAWLSRKLFIQDLLIEIAGVSVLQASLEDAAKLLKGVGDVVRLKVGRTVSSTEKPKLQPSSRGATPPSTSSPIMADDSELKEENKRLQEELSKLKKELLDSQEEASDLTQTVAHVSVEKTKLERQVHKLREQLSTQSTSTDDLAAVRTQLENAETDKASLEKELDSTRSQLKLLQEEHSSAQKTIQQLTKEKKTLSASVTELKEQLERERELRETAEHNLAAALRKQQESPEFVPKIPPKPPTASKPREPRSASPTEELPTPEEHSEPKEEEKEKEEEEEADDQENEEPLKEATEQPEVTAEDAVVATVNISVNGAAVKVEEEEDEKEKEAVVDAKDELEDDDADILSFNQVKSSSRLDASTALHKSHLSAQMRRKKPSREHVRSMASVSPFPESMPRLNVLEDEEEGRTAGMGSGRSTPVLPLIRPDEMPKKHPMKPPQPTPPKPKPRPQPTPRKKPSPEHVSSPTTPSSENIADKKRPMPAPRVHREEKEKDEVDGKIDSPTPSRRLTSPSPVSSPKHASPSHSPKMSAKPPVATPDASDRRPSTDSKPVRPRKPAKVESPEEEKEPRRPSTDSKPVRPRKPAKGESPEEEKEPRRPSDSAPKKLPKPLPPKPSRPQKLDSQATPEKAPSHPSPAEKPSNSSPSVADKLEAIKRKDPSELTVKEKMMLAQQAMAMQAEYKQKGLPPPVRKRKPLPKAMSVDSHDAEPDLDEVEKEPEEKSELERSQSMEDIVEADQKPRRPPKRLPPGAFNMALPGLSGDMRRRSNTVASTGSTGSAEGTDSAAHLDTANLGMSPSHSSSSKPSVDRTTRSPSPEPNSTPDRTPSSTPVKQPVASNSPSPHHVAALQEEEAMGSNHSTPELSRKQAHGSTDILDSYADMGIDDDNDEPPLPQSEAGGGPAVGAVPDREQVLFWTPEVVGMWLGSLGLGSHANSFKEKSIKGWMLFDLDNSKLKKLGVNSNDDRTTFKKELKVLKPYADKIKREYDRKKREDKKRLEQEKKLAKKKK